jgi:hypothetical protein
LWTPPRPRCASRLPPAAAQLDSISSVTRRAPHPAQNLFDGNATASRNYGVAPAFNQSDTSALRRLRNTGTATVGYDEQPIQASGAVNLGCGFGYVDPSFQAAYVGVGTSFFNKGGQQMQPEAMCACLRGSRRPAGASVQCHGGRREAC